MVRYCIGICLPWESNQIVASDYDKVEVSSWRRKVDVYESIDLDQDSSYAVVTGPSEDARGKSFLARLYIGRLGVPYDVQRFVSPKHRTLYIGAMPTP